MLAERAAVAKAERDLKEACLAEAMAIIAADGVEKLSLREVARRLGVSHQAPYRHFPSRDHILAELVARAFAAFAAFLDRHERTDDPDADMARMGEAYLAYARDNPLAYRLMFGTPLPDWGAHPEMLRQGRHAFSLLCEALGRRAAARGEAKGEDEILRDALFVWSCLHGLAAIRSSDTAAALGIPPALMEGMGGHVLARIGGALEQRPA
jgi:AcrR family transcriptional regulator